MTNIRSLINHFRTFDGEEAGDGGDGDTMTGGNPLDPLPPEAGTYDRAYGGLPNTTGGTSLTITLPTGTAGQLMVAIIGFRGSSAFTTPAGWTYVGSYEPVIGLGDGGPCGIYMAYRVRQAGDAAPTFDNGEAQEKTGCIVGYTGTGRATPSAFVGSSTTFDVTASASVRGNAVTISDLDTLIVVGSSFSRFGTTPDTSMAAVNIAVGVPLGTLAAAGPVSTTEWSHLFFNSLGSAADDISTFGFDLWWTGSGNTGQFAHNVQGGTAGNAMVVAVFKAP